MPLPRCQHVNDRGEACERWEATRGLCLGHLNAARVRALPPVQRSAAWRHDEYGPSRVRRLQRQSA